MSFWEDKARVFWADNRIAPGSSNEFYPWSKASSGMVPGTKVWRLSSTWWMDEANRMKLTSPCDPSPCREGLAIWDRAMLAPRRSTSVVPAGQATGPMVNVEWSDTLMALNDVTPGLEGKRPRGRYVWDLLEPGLVGPGVPGGAWDLIELAHMLTHRTNAYDKTRFKYSQTSTALAWNLFKIMFALKYDLIMDMNPEKSKEKTLDSLDKRGIRITMSRNFRNPYLDIPCTGDRTLRKDKDTAVIVASSYIEPQPNQKNVDEGKWMELNRWSCLPTVVCFAGWQSVDFVTHAQLVKFRMGKDLFWEIPVHSLENPGDIRHVLGWGMGEPGQDEGDGKRFFKVMDYLKSDSFAKSRKCSKTLPCRNCMKVNPRIDGCPSKPREKDPQVNEDWLKYEEGMERILDTCEKATKYFEGHIHGHSVVKKERKKRNSTSNRISLLKSRMERLESKAKVKMAKGFVSEARHLRKISDKLKSEIEESMEV